MSKFAWTWYACLSMVSLGVNMLNYAHDVTEVLQFTGGWLIVSGVLIPAVGFIVAWKTGKG